ncbi:histidinol dehydrogenase [Candidatus Villigracilis saccharophilus]|uniref:histidinol dehydrogenase n=1 Tax=Candidatus Villigracilis saccharophilus TaxID=3140684 RepID=UPI0031E9CD32
MGDYLAGPSHVKADGRFCAFRIPAQCMGLVKIVSLVALDEKTVQAISPIAATIAQAEGLDAHAN